MSSNNLEMSTDTQPPAGPPVAVPRFGPATPVVITIGLWATAVVSWWLIADPEWSIFKPTVPETYALLFWTILGFIVTGFTFGSHGFDRMSQPLAGIVHVVANLAFGIVGVGLFSYVLGDWDPTFAHDSPGQSGLLATAFVVLIAFYAYALVAASWGGYPFETLAQPRSGFGQFYQSAFLTLIGVVWLVYPNFSAALAPGAPVALPTALGWVYSSIVIVIMGAMVLENWPWAAVPNQTMRAATALVVTLVGGYGLYWVLRLVARIVVPDDVRSLATFSEASEAAQIGVCFSLWAITWGLVFGARPSNRSPGVNRVIRTVIVTVLALVTYVLFMRGFATQVLHMPAMRGSYGGDPLIWINWLILIVLWYAIAFGSIGSTTSKGGR